MVVNILHVHDIYENVEAHILLTGKRSLKLRIGGKMFATHMHAIYKTLISISCPKRTTRKCDMLLFKAHVCFLHKN